MASTVVPVPPPAEVLDRFSVSGRPRRLPGGRGTSWQVGRTVLKPLDMPLPAPAWLERALGTVRTPAVRVAGPLRSDTGRLVVAGWTAWPYLAGRHEYGRWPDIVAAGRDLHTAFSSLPRPGFLRDRHDRWSVADRVAWGESPLDPYLGLDTVRDLAAALRPVRTRPGLVHGDLTGNVLFHPDLPPAVIDISPYWRPLAFADAVVAADATGKRPTAVPSAPPAPSPPSSPATADDGASGACCRLKAIATATRSR